VALPSSVSYLSATLRAPCTIMLDINDMPTLVHGHQRLSLFDAHYGAAAAENIR
jgi:hypothetical protein